jgi:dTDP-4-dehydrorhamnose reductase
MTAVVFGAKGQLGSEFTAVFGRTGRRVIALDLPECDLAELASVRETLRRSIGPDDRTGLLFVNCAAYTDVEKAESDRQACERANIGGARNAALLATEFGAELAHFSTDYVFDGSQRTPYTETDAVNPLNHYGLTKLEGERAAASACVRQYCFRIAWLTGDKGNNFVRKIIQLGQARSELKVVDDQWGCPTFTDDVVRQVLAVAGTGAYGLYHCVNAGQTTWYRLTRRIFDRLGIGCDLRPCTSREYPQKALRPSWSVLENRRLREAGIDQMRPWETALEDFLSRNDFKVGGAG